MRHGTRAIGALVGLLAAVAACTSPPPAPWVTHGPGLGTVQALVVDSRDGVVYAGAGDGLFRSATRGDRWEQLPLGAPVPNVAALALDPRAAGDLWVGTRNGEVVRRGPAGAGWERVRLLDARADAAVAALAVDPAAPGRLWAGTRGSGVYASTDDGATWRAASEGLGDRDVRALVVVPTTPPTLVAGTTGGVFVSTDGGGRWEARHAGIGPLVVTALALDPTAPQTLWAGTSGSGVFRSTDAGASWTARNAGLAAPVVWALVVDPASPGTVYAGVSGFGGVFRTTNDGDDWHALVTGMRQSVWALACAPSDPGTLYAGTSGDGVYRSVGAFVPLPATATPAASPAPGWLPKR